MRNPRDEAIAAIARKYKSHPFVLQAIQNQKTGHYTPKGRDGGILGDFLAEAGTYALLSAEDEQELFGYIDAGYQLYEKLGSLKDLTPEQEEVFIMLAAAQQVVYHTNLRLAISVARPRMGFQNHMQPMDHVQEALIGLSAGINRFDKDRGYRFSTYATMWIRQRVTRAIADKSRTIRIPVHRHEAFVAATKKVNDFSNALGRPLTHEEIEKVSGMSYAKYGELVRQGTPNIPSLEQALPSQKDDRELGEIVGYNHMDPAIEAFSDREELAAIIKHADLREREKFIIGLRYGIEPELFGNPTIEIGGKSVSYAEISLRAKLDPRLVSGKAELTLEELGEIIGVTRERIRQIQNNALSVLRTSARMLERNRRIA